MTDNTETTMAQARMWAWDKLEGWGNLIDGKSKPWQMNERIERAEILALWITTDFQSFAEFMKKRQEAFND